ncbi:MAG: hypothetical protein J5I57_04090, partial [Melioribacteraceae bacterium]|nr:hypothetical protein [Melioribacteraceae bacterium]
MKKIFGIAIIAISSLNLFAQIEVAHRYRVEPAQIGIMDNQVEMHQAEQWVDRLLFVSKSDA